MRRLCFLLLLFILFYCGTTSQTRIEYFDNKGKITYLLHNISPTKFQLFDSDIHIFTSESESGYHKFEPLDPDIYGEIIIDKDSLDYNGEMATVSYYKRFNDFITIVFNNDDSPITFSRSTEDDIVIKHKSSDIGTIEMRGNGDYEINVIAHPDATKYMPYIVGGLVNYIEKH